MAAPRHRLRAHDGGALHARQILQTRNACAKFLCGHVIGVAAEGSVAPAEIRGIFFGVAETAEAFLLQVFNSLLPQPAAKPFEFKLRAAARLGNPANIQNLSPPVALSLLP